MIRSGIGIDSHRFESGRPLILGGVDIPNEEGLAGHSDADVLTHAVIDALLGAGGLGDIGQHFPDTDERFKDADSLELLRTVVVFLEENGFRIVHVDATVMMERPKLAPDRVNVKATRGEGLGFLGRVEGAAALAIATVEAPGAQ